jgi:hypothetical protein
MSTVTVGESSFIFTFSIETAFFLQCLLRFGVQIIKILFIEWNLADLWFKTIHKKRVWFYHFFQFQRSIAKRSKNKISIIVYMVKNGFESFLKCFKKASLALDKTNRVKPIQNTCPFLIFSLRDSSTKDFHLQCFVMLGKV